MTGRVVPSSWTQLRSWEQLERWRASRAGVIVILDEPTVSHFHDPWCDDVAESYFETKKRNVLEDRRLLLDPGRPTGRWVRQRVRQLRRHAGSTAHCLTLTGGWRSPRSNGGSRRSARSLT